MGAPRASEPSRTSSCWRATWELRRVRWRKWTPAVRKSNSMRRPGTSFREKKMKEEKTKHDKNNKTRQVKEKTNYDKKKQDKAPREEMTKQDKTRQNKTKQDKTRRPGTSFLEEG